MDDIGRADLHVMSTDEMIRSAASYPYTTYMVPRNLHHYSVVTAYTVGSDVPVMTCGVVGAKGTTPHALKWQRGVYRRGAEESLVWRCRNREIAGWTVHRIFHAFFSMLETLVK